MPTYTQDNRPMRIETPLGKDVLLLREIRGSDQLSQLFQYDVNLLADVSQPVEPDQIVGQNVTIVFRLPTGGERFINAIVKSFALVDADKHFTYYEAELVPAHWLLTNMADCRIFQRMSVPDILKKILSDYGLSFAFHLVGAFPPREYCVQYRETHFNFISRLMEQYGIFFFFRHERGKHTMVLANTDAAHESCPGQSTVRYQFATGAVTLNEDVVLGWKMTQQVRPTKYTLSDYNFETPSTSLLVNVAGLHAPPPPGVPLEVYDYPGEYLNKGEGEKLARLRIEEEEAPRTTISGRSNCRALLSGFKFELQEHPRREFNKPWVLTSVALSASEASYETGADRPFSYSNVFTAMPEGVTFRAPRVTPKPTVQGVQTAVVTGPKGEEIYTDVHGRVKIQFHWDRLGEHDENSSCWIRVSHPWAGKGWGAISLPRIGQEVIVDFVEGDPDQPIIIGRVYNAEQTPPQALPSAQNISGIKSNSTKGGGGYNEITMDDTKGKEKLNVHAQYDMSTTVLHDHSVAIINNHKKDVTGTHTETVKGDTTITISDGNFVHKVVKGTADYTVKGDVKETFQTGQSTTVTQNVVIVSTDASIGLGAAKEIKLVCGESMLSLRENGTIVISGKNITVTGGDTVKTGVGNQNVVCDKQKVGVSGAAINSSAVGMHEITGAVVKIN